MHFGQPFQREHQHVYLVDKMLARPLGELIIDAPAATHRLG
jgi:hypothetical protein